jgi:hypothetical protein
MDLDITAVAEAYGPGAASTGTAARVPAGDSGLAGGAAAETGFASGACWHKAT